MDTQIMDRQQNIRAILLRWVLPAAPPVILLTAFAVIAALGTDAVDAAVRYVVLPLSRALGTLTAPFPFSVMEIVYIVFFAWLIFFISRTVYLAVRSSRRLFLLRRLFILLITAAYLASIFIWAFGACYAGSGFAKKEGLQPGPVSDGELKAVTALFVDMANHYSTLMERESDLSFASKTKDFIGYAPYVYGNLSEYFTTLRAENRGPKPMYLFSKVMSHMGFTGVFFPFTGESNINIDQTPAMIPFTIAHELAHQQGVSSEDEANFLGVSACITSDDDIYRYSGYLDGTIHLMNALYKLDRDAWQELRGTFTPELEADWNANNAYWQEYKSQITEVSEGVYDVYLKASGQELGIRSYGACTDLLVYYWYPVAAEYVSE